MNRSPTPAGMVRGCFVVEYAYFAVCSWVFRGCWLGIHRMFATCSFSVHYIFAIQKYGFCRAKVWFLSCKKGVFTLQKYGFCFLNVMLLQIGRNVFRG